jgi:hypothetical protein
MTLRTALGMTLAGSLASPGTGSVLATPPGNG